MIDDYFLKYESYSCWVHHLEMTSYKVNIYNDKTYIIEIKMFLYDDEIRSKKDIIEKYSQEIYNISEKDFEDLKRCIKDIDFFSIPSDISSDGCDGYESYITVHTNDKSHKCGGYLPDNPSFDILINKIYNIVKWNLLNLYCNLKTKVLIDDNYFLKYEYERSSIPDYETPIGYDIYFYENGKYTIKENWFILDFNFKDVFVENHTLDKSNLDNLKSYLKNFDCPQDLNTIGICDGYSSYIEIKKDNQIKRFGGHNPQNENYLNLERLIQKIIKI